MKSKKTYLDSEKKSNMMDQNIRINKFLSNAGLCSRREADQYIKMGLVEVNGKIVTELGYKVAASDEVKYDGTQIKTKPFLYLLINKPKGFIATFQGDKIHKPVQDLISSRTNPGLIPVDDMGRPMTGLLILTNDRELRKRLNKSKSTKMVYKAVLNDNVTKQIINKLKTGQMVYNKLLKIKDISHINGKPKNEVGLEVNSIGTSELVKLFSICGLKVVLIDRVIYGSFTKKDLPRGKWRNLSSKEVGFLKMMS